MNTRKRKWLDVKKPPRKVAISIRVDADVLAFFKATGRGWQKLMNAVWRSYMEAHN